MSRTLTPLRQSNFTDWYGRILPSKYATHLFPSCVVRICIQNSVNNATEAIYFEITKMKDGTFWGKAMDTYRLDDWVGVEDGQQMTWRREHIHEIPLEGWQPKKYLKSVRGLVGQVMMEKAWA